MTGVPSATPEFTLRSRSLKSSISRLFGHSRFYSRKSAGYHRTFVQISIPIPRSIILWADESADWKVAGLRQIDRVVLALNEFFVHLNVPGPIPVLIRGGNYAITSAQGLERLNFTSDRSQITEGEVFVTSTRFVFERGSLASAFTTSSEGLLPGLIISPENTLDQSQNLQAIGNEGVANRSWIYLRNHSDIAHATSHLLRSTGKSQDGLVSRLINRPLSRALSQILIRLPASPNQLTLLFMLLPIAGGLFVLRGDYFGFAIGTILFQLHSAVDGCDGEIARIKYLESDFGSKLDAVCDRLSTLCFAVSLGFGLARHFGNADSIRWVYAAEGLIAAVLIGVAETLLTRHHIEDDGALEHDDYGRFVSANRQTFNKGDQLKLWMIRGTGMLSLGEAATSVFGELTKRDVFNFVFMLLALCGLAQWVLHILAVCACLIVLLAVKAAMTPALDANSAA